MRYSRFMPLVLLLLPFLSSCDKTLKVNADWKDVTVVYGLLDQTEDTTYIKITKAFLGEGNALEFAKVSDSSTYPSVLEVKLDEYVVMPTKDTAFIHSYDCDTVTIHNKKAGDSIFYYPNQLMYYSLLKLDENHIYKLHIRNLITGKIITGQTGLLSDFDVTRPQVTASFPAGRSFEVRWSPSKNGKRYQLVIRFFYLEALKTNTDSLYMNSIDWLVFNNIRPVDINSTQDFDLFFPGDNFYTQVGTQVPVNPLVTRVAHHCEFIFTVAATELNTYMEVTEPSLSLVQERPAYTNIVNGIGLFSARYMKSVDSLGVSQMTKDELRVNSKTKDLGF
ncbi:MAG: hypothetical protein WCK09_00910 [Bacteroidota bacterium]